MTTVVVHPANVASFPEGGGHFWVYLQYVHGLRQLGCDVFWLERFQPSGDRSRDDHALSLFFDRLRDFGLDGRGVLYAPGAPSTSEASAEYEFIGMTASGARQLFRRAELLLNFQYAIDPAMLARFRRTALVDIDPGLLQFWMAAGQLVVPPHDRYVTTGETVGTPGAIFPDCGVRWIHIHPPVCLDLWPRTHVAPGPAFTTISSWWGGGMKGRAEWVVDAAGVSYDNCKRVSFLEFIDLPRRTATPLELSLNLSDDPEDLAERDLLVRTGWRVRHAREAAATPRAYRDYIQHSRGEFSCAKPAYSRLRTAWVSDRTVCYLASGRPVVVQDTGPSSILPNGEGMSRFGTIDEAVEAFAAIEGAYPRHSRAARELAETFFAAPDILRRMLEQLLD